MKSDLLLIMLIFVVIISISLLSMFLIEIKNPYYEFVELKLEWFIEYIYIFLGAIVTISMASSIIAVITFCLNKSEKGKTKSITIVNFFLGIFTILNFFFVLIILIFKGIPLNNFMVPVLLLLLTVTYTFISELMKTLYYYEY